MTTIARTEITTQVAIIGAGPSGFLAAARLAGTHRRRVLVLDREKVAGGIPRHSDHLGYGMRDMHTLYQRSRVREAADLNCRIAGSQKVHRHVPQIRPLRKLLITHDR